MNVPKARKLPSGSWFIQLRLGGESIPVTASTEAKAIKEAMYIKAEYKAGRRTVAPAPAPERAVVTLAAAMDEYIRDKSNLLSPATIRGYRRIQKHQFKSLMGRDVEELAAMSAKEWQQIVNEEALLCSPKTLKNSFSFVKTVLRSKTFLVIPKCTLAAPVTNERAFLQPDEIRIFVKAIAATDVAVPALLALSSMRLSEIQALDWENIPEEPKFIRVSGAVVPDEHHQATRKKQNKNLTSARNVPILIPELTAALEQHRKPSGPVLDCSRSHFLKQVHRTCESEGITDVTIHGLRHSFASLAYSLQIPEKVVMEMGGWADTGTMHKIYTHIAQQDFTRYQTAVADFFQGKNANENANKK